jgi:hypothetical protein
MTLAPSGNLIELFVNDKKANELEHVALCCRLFNV